MLTHPHMSASQTVWSLWQVRLETLSGEVSDVLCILQSGPAIICLEARPCLWTKKVCPTGNVSLPCPALSSQEELLHLEDTHAAACLLLLLSLLQQAAMASHLPCQCLRSSLQLACRPRACLHCCCGPAARATNLNTWRHLCWQQHTPLGSASLCSSTSQVGFGCPKFEFEF